MNTSNEIKNIVVLNEDLTVRMVLKNLLRQYFDRDVKIYSASDGVQGLGYVFILKADIVIVDNTLPKHNGLDIIEYIKTNGRINEAKTEVIVLGEGKANNLIPAGYKYIDTTAENFPDNLIKHIGIRIPEYKIKVGMLGRFFASLGKDVVKFSNRSNSAIKSNNGKILPLRPWLKWTYYQFMAALNLTAFSFLIGRYPDENKEQQRSDIESNFAKNLPGIAIGLASYLLFSLTVLAVGGTFISIHFVSNLTVQATAKVWSGLGTDGTCGGAGTGSNWSCAGNWSPSGAPLAGDTVTFNGTGTNNATIDAGFQGTVSTLTIASGYTGTITLARAFTASSSFTQSAGNFNGSNQTMSTSAFSLSGGVFTSTSATMTIGGNFSITGSPTFNANAGTVTFVGGSSPTVGCNNVTFNLVKFTNGTNWITVNSDCNMPLGNNPSVPSSTGGVILNGTFTGTGTYGGNITQFNAGAVLSGFSGFSPSNVYFYGANLDFSGYATFSGGVTQTSGAISLPNTASSSITLSGGTLNAAGTVNLTVSGSPTITAASGTTFSGSGFSMSAGTFNAPAGNINIAGSFGLTGTTTFNANGGTITFTNTLGAQTISCTPSVIFNKIVIAGTYGAHPTFTLNSGCTLPLGNNPTTVIGNADSQYGWFKLYGTLSGTGTITFGLSSAILTVYSTGSFSGFSGFIDNGGVSGSSIDFQADLDFSGYTTFSNTSFLGLAINANVKLPPNSTNTPDITINNGHTLTSSSGTLNLGGNLSISSTGVYNANGGTINFNGTGASAITCAAPTTFNNFQMSKTTTAGTFTLGSGCTATMTGNNVSYSGALTVNGTLAASGSVTINGGLTVGGTFSGISGTLALAGPLALTSTTAIPNTITGISGMTNLTITSYVADFSGFSPFSITGIITINSGSLILPNNVYTISGLTISGGTFTAPSVNMNISGYVNISGTPTFNANGGTITFTNTVGDQTISCTPSTIFNKVAFAGAYGAHPTFTLNSGCTLPLGNNPTTVIGSADSQYGWFKLYGTLSGTGTITFGLSSALLTVYSTGSFSGFSGFSIIGNVAGTPVDFINNLDFSGYDSFNMSGGSLGLQIDGNIKLPTNSTVAGSITISNTHTLTSSSGTLNLGGNLSINTGGTFTSNGGTINFTGANPSAITCTAPTTFNNFQMSKTNTTGTFTLGSGCTATMTGNNVSYPGALTVNGTLAGSGAVTVNGAVTIGGTYSGLNGLFTLSGALAINSATAFSSSSLTGITGLTNLNIAGTADFSSFNTFGISGTITVSSGSLSLPNSNLTMTGLTQLGGTITAASGVMNITGNINITSGTYNANGGTLNITGSNTQTVACISSTNFNKVTLTKSGGVPDLTVQANCNLPLGNNPTIDNIRYLYLYGTLSGTGALTFGASESTIFIYNGSSAPSGFSSFYMTSNPIDISGTADFSNYTSFTSAYMKLESTARVTLPSGSNLLLGGSTYSLWLASGSVFNAPSGNLSMSGNMLINSGSTFNSNSGTLTFTGTGTIDCNNVSLGKVVLNNSGMYTVGSTCALPLGNNPTIATTINNNGTLSGTGTLTMTAGTLTLASGSTFSGFSGLTGTSESLTMQGPTVNASAYTVFNVPGTLSISAGTLTLPPSSNIGVLTITGGAATATTGDVTIPGTLSITTGAFTAPSGNLNLGGNFAHVSGTFTHNSGTVVLNGASQTLSGIATTFNNLTKNVPSATPLTLTFPSGITETVAGTTTLNGFNSSNRLLLRSSSSPTQWKIDPQGTKSASYLDVKDANNVNATIFATGVGALNGLNNTNFDFSQSDPVVWLKMDEASGTSAADSSGNGLTGTATGTSVIAGPSVNARQFTISESEVQVPNNAVVSNAAAITASAWVNIAAYPTNGYDSAIIAMYDNSTNAINDYGGFYLSVSPSGVLDSSLNGESINVVTNVNSGSNLVPLNTWTFVTMTYSSSTYKVYINGNLYGTNNSPGVKGVTANPLEIGRLSNRSYASYPYFHLNGGIDDVRVYNRQLNDADVTNLYSSYSATPIITTIGPTSLVNAAQTINTQPTFNFSMLSQGNAQYEIQISTHSDFSSNTIDYTSALVAAGSLSYTVGQNDAGGTYSAGSHGTTLAPGTYYWRVKGINGSGTSGSYYTASNGGIGFYEMSPNPIAWWKFENNLNDSAGSNTATAVGTADYYTGGLQKVDSYAIGFNGTKYVTLPQSLLNVYPSGTVSLWFKADTSPTKQYLYVYSKSGTSPEIRVYLAGGTLNFYGYDFGAYQFQITTPFSDTTSWHHIVGTWQNNDARLYLDGNSVGTPDTTVSFSTGYTTTSHSLGYYSLDDSGTRFVGKMDDVRLYPRAVSASEVTDIYNYGLGLPTTTALGSFSLVDGSTIVNTQPTFSFTITAQTNVKYQIQISKTSNFSSNVMDYTSGLGAAGNLSFVPGQDAGSGTYTTGTPGQALSAGTYYWRVKGINDTNQNGLYTTAHSGGIGFILTTLPDPPTSLTAIVGDAQAQLSWTAPANNGGYAITDYLIEYKLSADSSWTPFVHDLSNTTSALIVGLTNGLSYNYRVSAITILGTGSPSNTVILLSDITPNIPTNLGPSSVISAIIVPTLKPVFTFTINDPNLPDTVQYQFQIDDNSDFSSPVIDYTSNLQIQGAKTFTVGQSAGSGAYAVGSLNQSLTTGSYYWRVKAFDNYTLSSVFVPANGGLVAFLIDSQAPDAFTPTLNVTSPTLNRTPTVTFNTTDNVAVDHYDVKIDSGDFTTQLSPYTIPKQNDGDHTITVRAYDTTSNFTDGVVNVHVTVNAPNAFTPTLNITSPTNNTAPIVSFFTTDDQSVTHYELKIDSGSFTTQTSPYQLPILLQGNHTITVRAFNPDNITTDGTVNFTIDTTNPYGFTPTINVGAYTTNQTPTLTFQTFDNLGVNHYEVKVNSGAFTTQVSPYILPTLAEGVYTFTVRAFDTAGNYTDGTVLNTTVDLTNPNAFTPTIDVTSPTSNTRPTITFSTTDNFVVNHYEVKIGNGAFVTETSPFRTDALVQDTYAIIVRAFDSAGNHTDGTTINLVVDETGPNAFTPTLNVVSPTNNIAPIITYSTTDNVAVDHYDVKVDNADFSTEDSPFSLPDLAEGAHVIIVRAFDTSGNYTDATVNLVVDLTAPLAFSPRLNTNSITSNVQPILSFDTSDKIGINHYSVKIDSGSFSTRVSPYTLPVQALGSHTITVRAFDAAGNYRQGTVINFTVDTIAPADFIPTLNVTSPTINTTPTVTFSTTDNLAINYYLLKVDTGSFIQATSPYQIPPLGNGPHAIIIRAYDSAGNYKEESVSVTIDRTSPDPFTPTVSSGNPSNIANPILSFNTSDDLGIGHYEVKIDNGSFTTQTSPFQLPTLTQTNANSIPHTITVRAFNVIGSTTDGVISLYIDTTAPTINIASPTLIKNTSITNTTIGITDNLGISLNNVNWTGGDLNCTVYSSISISCKSVISESGTLTVNATDNAGNLRTVTVPGYVIDTIAPQISLTAPTKESVKTITDTTFFVTDDVQIKPDRVLAISGGSIICLPTTLTQVDCTVSVADSGDLVINAYDTAGNVVALTEAGYVVTATPPEPFTPTLNTTPYTSDTAPILFFSTTDTDGIDNYGVKVNTDQFSTQVSPYQMPEQSVGFKTITVRATDSLGNFRDESIGVTIDNSTPATFTPILNVTSPTNNQNPHLTFFTTDTNGIDHYEVKEDNGSFTTQVSPYTLPTLAEGDHTITVRAFNLAGNYTDGTVSLTVDLTPPAAFTPVITQGATTNEAKPDLTYSTTDNIAIGHYEVQVDSGSFSIQPSPYMIPTIPEGYHDITVVAYDTAGNSRVEEIGVTVDLTLPVISYDAPTKVSGLDITDTTINVRDDIGIEASQVTADGGALDCTQTSPTQVDCTSVVSVSGTMTIHAIDNASNSASADIPDYIIDREPAVITITAPTKKSVNTITDTIINITDNYGVNVSTINATGGVIDCIQTSPTVVDCTSSISINGDLVVNAVDTMGNPSTQTEAGYIITRTVPVEFTPTLNTGSVTNNTTPTVSFITTDPEGINHYDIKVDDGEFSTQGSPYLLPALQEGFHTIIVRAFSNNGTFRDGSVTVTIDLTNPTTLKINLDVDSPTNNSRPTIKFRASDENGIDHYEVKVASNSGTFLIATSPYQVPDNLEDGDHTVTVRAFDKAGNTIEASSDFTLDTIAPTGSILINNDDVGTKDNKVTLRIKATDERTEVTGMIISENADFKGASYEPYTESKPAVLSSDVGKKTLYIKFKDKAGNESQEYSDSIIYDPTGALIQKEVERLQQQAAVNNSKADLSTGAAATLIAATIGTVALNVISSPNLLIYGIFILKDRKKKRAWGIIYNQDTKKPIPFATVRIYSAETNKLIAQRVSGLDGKYGFVEDKGSYILEVRHSDYKAYKQEFKIEKESSVNIDVALSLNGGKIGNFKETIREKLYSINTILVYGGLIFSVGAFVYSQTAISLVVLVLYIVQISVLFILDKKKSREWGYVYNSENGKRVQGAFVRLFRAEDLEQIDVVITDSRGRYYFDVKPGNYLISADRDGYKFPSETESKSELYSSKTNHEFIKKTVQKEKGVNLIIALDPK